MVASGEAAGVRGWPGSSSQTGSALFGDVRLLERERELGACTAALERCLAGGGGMVVVEGPPGIGKTALLRAVRQQASGRGLRVLAARGLEVERQLAFGGVRQLLEPVLRVAPPAEAARLLSGAATPAKALLAAGPVSFGRQADPAFAMVNALYWVLARLADALPLLVAVDDAHWLDAPSLRLLDFLVPRIEELRALVVVATRPPSDGDDPSLRRIVVDPVSTVIGLTALSRRAVAELVRARLGEDPDPGFVDACVEVTAGNPFYLAELLRELAVGGIHPGSGQAHRVRTVGPGTISRALRFRTAAASDGAALACALAVLGDGARLDQVAALAGLEQQVAANAADALVRESILAPGPELSFAHPILRTAVYADLGRHHRASMHERAAGLLHGAGAPAQRIAAHLLRTDPAGDAWVVEVLRAAAAAGLGQGAPDTAAHHLRRALVEPPDNAVRPQLLLELGRAEASVADPGAPAHLAEAYALAADPATRADAALQGALSLFAAGRVNEALAMLAAVAEDVAEVAHHDRDRALELEAELVSLAMYEPSVAPLHLRRLARIDEGLPADSPGARLMLCLLACWRMWRSQDAARATELAERALAGGLLLAERGPEALQFSQAAMTLICADRLESAAALLDAALAQAHERGSRYGFWVASFLRSELAYRQGALADVEADAHATLDITIPSGMLMGAVAATSMLIAALLERGALDEAADALDAIRFAEGEVPPQPFPYNLLLTARGRLRLARGDLGGGLEDLHECGRRNEALEIRNPVLVPWRVDAALAHRAQGELDAARALAREELDAAHDWGTPGAIGSAQRLTALLSSGDEAIGLLREAVEALAASPARLEYARALVDLGAALRRGNRRTEAREPLTRGLEIAGRCGATVLRQRAFDELAAMGARPRRTRLTGIDALTASERRVARMAASGLSNAEIAQTLFVTRKTIEKHLGNAYTKLGINSRDALSVIVLSEDARVP